MTWYFRGSVGFQLIAKSSKYKRKPSKIQYLNLSLKKATSDKNERVISCMNFPEVVYLNRGPYTTNRGIAFSHLTKEHIGLLTWTKITLTQMEANCHGNNESLSLKLLVYVHILSTKSIVEEWTSSLEDPTKRHTESFTVDPIVDKNFI